MIYPAHSLPLKPIAVLWTLNHDRALTQSTRDRRRGSNVMNKRFNYACLMGGVRFSRRNEARTQRHANGGCIWRLFGTFWEKDGAGVLAANRASGRSAKYIGIPLVSIHASNFPLPPLGSIRGPVGAWMNAGRALY